MHDASTWPPQGLSASALLGLLRLTSPALPVGAYAYSRGLEHAVHSGAVHDEASALAWIAGLSEHNLARLDAPIFARLHAAHVSGDRSRAEHWNRVLLSSRESNELRLEETQIGGALARLLVNSGVAGASDWIGRADACYATLFALGAVSHGIGRQEAVLGFLWALCESQTSAAVRLIPLGQTAGQRMVSALIERLPAHAQTALQLSEDEIGALAPGLAIGSALHETQYTRLFRS